MEITQPLRLAVGSHSKGSGKGCVMNIISWENGDATITDYPSCADKDLARMAQAVNDNICTHRDGDDLLCAECSQKVLALGHRTVGTALDRPRFIVTEEQYERYYAEATKHQEAVNAAQEVWDNVAAFAGDTLARANAAYDAFFAASGIQETTTAPEVIVEAYEACVLSAV